MKKEEEYQSAPGRLLIHQMAADDRPREKALKHGIKSLTDSELMAIIFSTGMKGKSVIQLSEEILHDNDNHLSVVARLSVADLTKRYKGLGSAKAISLLAALELGARSAHDALTVTRPKVKSAGDAVEIMKRHFAGLNTEEFWLMLLNAAGRVIKEIKIGQGGVSAVMADSRIILKHIIDNLASAAIVFHNHPSGALTPSAQDDAITRRLVNGAAAVGSRINDHIIITDSGYYSYCDEGRLPEAAPGI